MGLETNKNTTNTVMQEINFFIVVALKKAVLWNSSLKAFRVALKKAFLSSIIDAEMLSKSIPEKPTCFTRSHTIFAMDI